MAIRKITIRLKTVSGKRLLPGPVPAQQREPERDGQIPPARFIRSDVSPYPTSHNSLAMLVNLKCETFTKLLDPT
jgi:hypothetical protein